MEQYDDLYLPFQQFFDDLLTQRSHMDMDTYVPMAETEREIIGFTLAQHCNAAIVIGETGIGKTTIFSYLDKLWEPHDCLVFRLDMRDEEHVSGLPDGYTSLPEQERSIAASPLANRILCECFQERLNEFLKTSTANDKIQFIERFDAGCLPPSVYRKAPDFEGAVDELMRTHRWRFLQLMLYYFIQGRSIEHIKIIIDNTDDKDPWLIEQMLDLLGHMSSKYETLNRKEQQFAHAKLTQLRRSPTSDRDSQITGLEKALLRRRRLTYMITCRPPTAARLAQKQRHDHAGVHGLQEIRILKPCDIGKAIKKRFDKFVKTALFDAKPRKVQIEGKEWHISPIDFFDKLCTFLDEERHARRVLRLCNNDVAMAMHAILDLVRYKEYLNLHAFAADVYGSGHPKDPPIVTSQLIKAMAYYGNENSTKKQYPGKYGLIPNLLHSEHAKFGKTMFKPRIVSMLLASHRGQTKTVTLHDIVQKGKRLFRVTEESAIATVNELAGEGVLFHAEGFKAPSEVGMHCELHLSPRGDETWSLLRRNTVVLSCYRDALPYPDGVWREKEFSWDFRASSEAALETIAEEIVWYCSIAIECELREVSDVINSGEFDAFCREFGETFISEILCEALGASLSYYCKQQGWQYDELANDVDELRRRVSTFKRIAKAQSRFSAGDTSQEELQENCEKALSDIDPEFLSVIRDTLLRTTESNDIGANLHEGSR